MINSRKLGVQAIVTLQVRIETLRDVEAAVDVDMGNGGFASPGQGEAAGPAQIETMKRTVSVAAIAVRRKDTYRMKGGDFLTGGEAQHRAAFVAGDAAADVATKPLDGKLHIDGDLNVFAIYQAEDENMPVQWLEETLPFSGSWILPTRWRRWCRWSPCGWPTRTWSQKPDYDGEMRELDVDAVLELDIKLYREQELELLSDMYSTSREVELSRAQAWFRPHAGKERLQVQGQREAGAGGSRRILQICHSEGMIKLDEVEIGEDNIQIDGCWR